jgi:hypothetical protein
VQNVTCPYCKETMPDDPGSYYHRKRCEADDVLRRMREAKARGVNESSDEWASLERALFRASYTGD